MAGTIGECPHCGSVLSAVTFTCVRGSHCPGPTQRPDDDPTLVCAVHLYGVLRFERVKQDRRVYYRLTRDGRSTGSLTTLQKARETVQYWRKRGWISPDSSVQST